MKLSHLRAWVLVGMLGAGLAFADAADAKPGRGNGNGNSNRPSPVETVEEADDLDVEVDADDVLTADRVETILDILSGDYENHEDLISEELRLAILADVESLPPGIQRQLARGRGLPPGIAKKYQIPVGVLPIIDLDPDYELLVIGDNIVVVDPAQVVIDIIEGIF